MDKPPGGGCGAGGIGAGGPGPGGTGHQRCPGGALPHRRGGGGGRPRRHPHQLPRGEATHAPQRRIPGRPAGPHICGLQHVRALLREGSPLHVAHHTTGDSWTVNVGLIFDTGPKVSSSFSSTEWKCERNVDAKLHRKMERNSKRIKINTNLMSVPPCDFSPQQMMF